MVSEPTAVEGLIVAPETSRAQRVLSGISWSFFWIFFLILFTILKLPEDRLKNFIQGSIQSKLAPMGISMTAGESSISMGFGISYVMKDVTFRFPPPAAPAHIDEMSVSPSILSLLAQRLGGSAEIRNGSSRLWLSFSVKGTAADMSFTAKSLDLGKIGLLPLTAGLSGGAIVDGHGSFSGDPRGFAGASIDLDLDIKNLVLDAQSIQGIPIPRISISEGKILADTEKGHLAVKKLQLGKSGNSNDDIRGNLSGDITLGRTLDLSTGNLKAVFSISQNVLKPLFLLDAILAPGKQPDGSYSFRLTGPLFNMNPTPEPP
jgi:type II secretion system protein N